jgi:DNA-directed RNA polymerase subunit RPC12/RpoP
MTIYQPATPYSDLIKRPDCAKCGTGMLLTRIEPDKRDHDKRAFECPKCGNKISEIVKFR